MSSSPIHSPRPARELADQVGGVRWVDVLRFNAPLVGAAALAATVGLGMARAPLPRAIRTAGALGSVAALHLLAGSALAARLVFGPSGVTDYRWLTDALGGAPRRWLNVTTGFDDTTGTLARLWPESTGLAIDRFDVAVPHERALRAARALRPPSGPSTLPSSELPLPDASVDAVLLLMAAHEVRAPGERRLLFREAARVLEPGGLLIVVEHLRDAANTLVFGPGSLHFERAETWRRAGTDAGLRLDREARRTPFVRSFRFRAP
jgi:SAM-dependent methyltransferase